MKKYIVILLSLFSFAYADLGDDSERAEVQDIVRQTRTLAKAKAQIFIAKDGIPVYRYSNPRGALRRMHEDGGSSGLVFDEGVGFKETFIASRIKGGAKVKIIPLEGGIGVVRRPKQKGSYYYVVMAHFETESERAQRIAEENAPKPKQLKLGSAKCTQDAIMFEYYSDYETFLSLSQQADEEALIEWCQVMASRGRAYIAKKDDRVLIEKIDGNMAKILRGGKSYIISTRYLQSAN